MQLLYHVICHQFSHVAYPRQPFNHNGIGEIYIFYAKNQGLFHSASEARALLYLP
jgi:hypothetical protein